MKYVQLSGLVNAIETWNPQKCAPQDSFQYIDLSAIDQETKSIVGARQVECENAPSRARQLVQTGDILVSTVRPNLNGVAKVPDELDGAIASTGFCVLRPNRELLDRNFLFQWVKSTMFIGEMVRLATGASYPAVSDRIVLASSIPLPPLPEQRRIAAILDQADALRAKRREALAQLDSLTQSIFIEMFGDPVENPNGWKLYPLQKVCSAINDCPHTTPKWTTEGIICLRTSNLTKGGWLWKDTRYVTVDAYHERSKRGYLKTGDIVLSREGTVGIAAIVPDGLQVCMGQRLVQVRPDNVNVNSDYLLYHLLYVLAPSRLSKLMVGSTTHHLNVKELRDLKVPVPPLNVQREFSQRITQSNDIITANRNSSTQLQKLFDNLQHLAFRGEL